MQQKIGRTDGRMNRGTETDGQTDVDEQTDKTFWCPRTHARARTHTHTHTYKSSTLECQKRVSRADVISSFSTNSIKTTIDPPSSDLVTHKRNVHFALIMPEAVCFHVDQNALLMCWKSVDAPTINTQDFVHTNKNVHTVLLNTRMFQLLAFRDHAESCCIMPKR